MYGKNTVKDNFKDNELLTLSQEIEEVNDDEASLLAKKYLRKLMYNFREMWRLVDEDG